MGGACSAQATRPRTQNSLWWRQAGARNPTSRRPNTTTPGSTVSTHHKTCWTLYKFLAKKGGQETWPSTPFSLQDKRQIPDPTQECESSVWRFVLYLSYDQLYSISLFHPVPDGRTFPSPWTSWDTQVPLRFDSRPWTCASLNLGLLYSISFCTMAGMN